MRSAQYGFRTVAGRGALTEVRLRNRTAARALQWLLRTPNWKPPMTPEDREYLLERAEIERALAVSAPDDLLQLLHLEIAARYESIVKAAVTPHPHLRLVVNRA